MMSEQNYDPRTQELRIEKPYATVKEVRLQATRNQNEIRMYHDSPGTIALQVRVYKPITNSGQGAPRNMVAHVRLTQDDIRALFQYAHL